MAFGTNGRSTIGVLAGEVADLIRHDNLDPRIFTWLGMAFQDLAMRVPGPMFHSSILTGDITDTDYVDISSPELFLGNIVCVIFRDTSSSNVYVPEFVTPSDFSRFAHAVGGGALESGTIPLRCTISTSMRKGESSAEDGKNYLWVYPKISAGTTYKATIIYQQVYGAVPSTSTAYVRLPYHFENALIWGAAAFGMSLLRPQLYPIYASEYEQAVQDMKMMLNYFPDSTPVFRSIRGVYENTPRMLTPPRFPTNIG